MSSVNMNSLMAARNAILNRNNALQDIASKTNNLASPGQIKQTEQISDPKGFAAQLTDAIQEVNKLQATAKADTAAYQMGETNDVAAVMLSKHKASIGFESTLQVRNKLLSAYKDIMNMSV
ncbi:flagellar hook-basal body complex protein FliE [Sphingorhabdus sp. EL138]|uniref:flagellar hook-basal body complex protein FliE n=1 Tax=Sphingorhabdus sp. EL138 TaxID=2073156 RepID=UPI000D69D6B2|nr:flagellar hook-basal body complex protein FliE [Sphingorhabdus sp. EL138]